MKQIEQELRARQRRLLVQLCQIYPIASPQALPADAARELAQGDAAAAYAQLALRTAPCIRGLALPPLPAQLLALDDEHAATAMGYAAHLLLLLAKLWGVPLRYRLLCQGSRCHVLDDVTQTEFPLFTAGGDRDRFECAWLLLNKNVHQLARARGLTVSGNFYQLLDILDLLIAQELPR